MLNFIGGSLMSNEKNSRKLDPNKTNMGWGLSWILNHPELTYVFLGMDLIEQIDENRVIGNKIKAYQKNLIKLKKEFEGHFFGFNVSFIK